MVYLSFFDTVSQFLDSIWNGISQLLQMLGNFVLTLLSLVQVLADVISLTPYIVSGSLFPAIISAVAAVAIAMGILRLIWW